jgi:hypothetical protein
MRLEIGRFSTPEELWLFVYLGALVTMRLEIGRFSTPEELWLFVYLGALVTPNNDMCLETKRIIQTANRCIVGLQKHLRSSHLARQTKFEIYKNLIRPVLMYGSETWVLTKGKKPIALL